MADIEKILDGLNIPKQILEKSEALFKTLFGASFKELGGIFADQVRLRRFNNQIKIFTKAQERLKKHNINPQKVSLKVLAPLIEYSSLEEEENLQDKWSNLISHILGGDKEIVFQQNCITILNRISSEEAKLLDTLYELLQKKRSERKVQLSLDFPNGYNYQVPLSRLTFNILNISKELNVPIAEMEFSVSNLITLGLLKWETDVDVLATKSDFEEEIDVDVNVSNTDDFVFTPIGVKFIEVCKD